MTEQKTEQNGKPRRRWVQIALVASLAVNLLVAGLVVGALFGRHHRGDHDFRHRDRGLMSMGLHVYGGAMDRADRRALRSAAIARRDELRAGRGELHGHFAQMITLLRAEPFSAEALTEAMEAQRVTVSRQIGIGQDLLIERISAMSPAARRAFADRMEERLTHMKRGR